MTINVEKKDVLKCGKRRDLTSTYEALREMKVGESFLQEAKEVINIRTVLSACMPDDDFGAIVHAIVQPTERARGSLDAEAMIAFLRDRLVTYILPRSFEFVDGPLRDDAGKVRRQQLREERLIALQADGLRARSKAET